MSIEQSAVEQHMEKNGFVRSHETKKLIEYRSSTNGKYLYLRTDIGLPDHIRIVVHPDENTAHLTACPGIEMNQPKQLQHGSNMRRFPTRRNRGESQIPYGRAINIASLTALNAFASAFHML